MAFAEESPYVAQKAEDDGMASKVAKPDEFPLKIPQHEVVCVVHGLIIDEILNRR